mmetsp:Transcript_112590/g.223821  ORF Transcript_112590/g.223821 Transcript_112590/m.223821 type:complete len:340 (+) Transcript_112590:52-1071(+)
MFAGNSYPGGRYQPFVNVGPSPYAVYSSGAATRTATISRPPPYAYQSAGNGCIRDPAAAGDCAGVCGGAETACVEANDAIAQHSHFDYVGEGRGGYSAKSTYDYVGEGAGSFDRVVATTYTGWKLRPCCIGLTALLLLPALIYGLMLAFKPEDYTKGSTDLLVTIAPTPSPVAPEPFDCTQGGLWSMAKKEWCCAHYHKGCTTRSPPSGPPPPRPPPPPPPIRVNVPVPHPIPVPVPVPVPAPIAPTPPPFDCNADFVDCPPCLATRWSVGKRAWCCAHAHRGCPVAGATTPTTTPKPIVPTACPCPPQDCNIAFQNWRAAWSPIKKNWCCQHEHKGCA